MWKFKVSLLIFFTIVICIGLLLHQPIAQDPTYHDFADQRMFFGIPHFSDVVSNLPFIIFGILGVFSLSFNKILCFRDVVERKAYWFFFIGSILVGLGSGYYHWNPDNATLVYDRWPMTLAFMSIFSAVLNERVSLRCAPLLWFFLPLGCVSVFYWHVVGDLRFYYFVQFFPLACIVLMMSLFPSPYTKACYLWWSFASYAFAKVLEILDKPIFALTDGIVSGHTLKHLFAALSIGLVWVYLEKRRLRGSK